MSNKIKLIQSPGSLSETDLELLVGTDILLSMMRNRILIVLEDRAEINWVDLMQGVGGFYHVRSINHSLYQVWFERPVDLDMFNKNLAIGKLSDTVTS